MSTKRLPRTIGEVYRRLADPKFTCCDRTNEDGSACWTNATQKIPDHQYGPFFCPKHAREELATDYPKKART